MTKAISCLIKGAWYRPPAQAILNILPVGTKLELRPEPNNEHDKHAIAIFVSKDNFPSLNENQQKKFAGLLADAGLDAEEIESEPEFHLGYIPVELAARLKLVENTPAEFTFSLEGKPSVTFKIS